MRVPLSWLREYVEVEATPEVLAEHLPMLGIGVEGVTKEGGEYVFDLEIASNRPDLLSLIGLARELAAWGRQEVHLPADELEEGDPPAAAVTTVEIRDPALCPRYVAHVITGVTVGPSPPEIAARLEAAGVRPINAVVDATNYVMLEWGQPLHAFDLETLAGRRIVVRPAAAGESLVTLDGVEREMDPQVLVVADAERPVAMAGVMGGAATEIGPFTRDVLLEAAAFAPASIRRTSRRFGLRTEASRRFERGVDPEGTLRAARRAAALIARWTGGCVLRSAVDAYPHPAARPEIRLRLARVARLLGVTVPSDEVAAILRRLGVEVQWRDQVLVAIPPVGRRDLEREEDLIEEVARHYGYDRIPEALPVEVLSQGRWPPRLEAEAAARDALIRSGLTEAFTVSLISMRSLDRLGLDGDDPWRRAIPLQNPLTADHTHLRSCLIPGLLEAVRVNVSRRLPAVHLFEIGRIFRPAPGKTGEVEERRTLAVAMYGRWVADWSATAAERDVTLFHLKGVLEALAAELRLGTLAVTATGPASLPRWLHPGRAGWIALDGNPIGLLGQLHPDVAAQFDLHGRAYVAELDLEPLLDGAVLRPRFAELPRQPAVRRDLAVQAPDELPHATILTALRDAGGAWLESVELFDVYSGPPLPAGSRSLAYTLIFRAPDRTLVGDEVDALMAHITSALASRLGVTIRA